MKIWTAAAARAALPVVLPCFRFVFFFDEFASAAHVLWQGKDQNDVCLKAYHTGFPWPPSPYCTCTPCCWRRWCRSRRWCLCTGHRSNTWSPRRLSPPPHLQNVHFAATKVASQNTDLIPKCALCSDKGRSQNTDLTPNCTLCSDKGRFSKHKLDPKMYTLQRQRSILKTQT